MLIKANKDEIISYLEDTSNIKGGYADAVIFSETTEELAEFIKAKRYKPPLWPSGAGTGTVGGRIPFGGTVVATDKLNRIGSIAFDDKKELYYVRVGAGVRLGELYEFLKKNGFIYPNNPTEKTSTIGGNTATNASGSRSFKYGSTRDWIRSIRVVLSTGDILDIARGDYVSNDKDEFNINIAGKIITFKRAVTYETPPIKSAAGYYSRKNMELIDLFIGSEGTLGIITEVELYLQKNLGNITAIIVPFYTLKECLNFVEEIKRLPDKEAVTISIEYFDTNSLGLLKQKYKRIPVYAKFALLIELLGDEEKVLDLVCQKLNKYDIKMDDCWYEKTTFYRDGFEDFRHTLPEIANETYRSLKVEKVAGDIAVPADKLEVMLGIYYDTLQNSGINYIIFGHIGDAHLHVNLFPGSQGELEKSKEYILHFCKSAVKLGGVVSAEHGIGKLKKHLLELMYGREEGIVSKQGLVEMAKIKKTFDPELVLAPGNMIPLSYFD